MTEKLNILYLEDNPNDAELVESMLKNSGIQAYMKIVQTKEEFVNEIQNGLYNIIFSDYSLPSFSGRNAIEIAKKSCPEIPFIFVSGTMGEDTAIESLLTGATDYVLKTKLSRLAPAVKRALKEIEELNEKKKARKELIESEERFRMLAESALAFIIIYNKNNIVYANPAFLNACEYSSDEIYSQTLWDIAAEEFKDLLKERAAKRLSGKPVISRFEFKIKTKSSKEIWLDASGSRITYRGEPAGLIYSLDITEKKKIEIALKEAKERAEEMSRLKSFFLSNVSHELRTPLNGIMGFAELMLNDGTEEDKPKAAAILKSANRLSETLNMILDLSRIEANERELKLQSSDIIKWVEKVIESYVQAASYKNIELKFIPGVEKVCVRVDTKLFYSVISNLVNNAIKYTSKGSVKVFVNKIIEDGKTKAVIKIADTGIGIEPEKLPVIYEEFRQGSEGFNRGFEGLGIGLTITKKFIAMMNGVIDVKSEINKGTEFMIKFDTADEFEDKALNISVIERQDKTNAGNVKILIVEDEEINRNLARLFLRKFSKTEEAINAVEAIEKCRQVKYDAILMDINLGKGMNGLEAAREIKKMPGYAEVPIVAVTAYVLDDDENKYLKEGCTHYLPKPYNQGQLIALLNELVI